MSVIVSSGFQSLVTFVFCEFGIWTVHALDFNVEYCYEENIAVVTSFCLSPIIFD